MKQILTLFVLVIILSTCKKPEDEMLRKRQELQASASAGSDATGDTDPQAFTEFTDVYPNPRASENLREVPPPNVHHPEPPEKPLYKSVRIHNFKPLGQAVTKTYDYNIPGFLLNKIGAENLYKRLAPIEHTVYYNNTLYEFLDIPAPSNQYFNATFTFTAQQGAPQTLYARLFYESVTHRVGDGSGYWGGTDIITFRPTSPATTLNIYYKIKHDPHDSIKNNYPERWPYWLVDLPRAGDYDFILVVADDSALLKPPASPIGHYTIPRHEGSPAFDYRMAHTILDIKYSNLHVTALDEGFDNDKNVLVPPLAPHTSTPNGNLFGWYWYPNANTNASPAGANAHYNPVPNIKVPGGAYTMTAENYTEADYNVFKTIPADDPLRFKTINENNPVIGGYEYCFYSYFYENIDVSGSLLKLINKGQPYNPLANSQIGYDANGDKVISTDEHPILSNYSRSAGGVSSMRPFLYGKVSARIKFPNIVNDNDLPNGLFPAFWLREYLADDLINNAKFRNDYYVHCNSGLDYDDGTQPQEIDIEVFKGKAGNPPSTNPGKAYIAFSIVDFDCGGIYHYGGNGTGYSCGSSWTNIYGYEMIRCSDNDGNNPDGSAISHFMEVDTSFFQTYHTYTIDWKPRDLTIYIDGVQRVRFSVLDAKIPAFPMTINFTNQWGGGMGKINGTDEFIDLKSIPFPASDKVIEVDWVKVE